MVAESDKTPDHYIWSVEVSPPEVDAGAELALKCRIACPAGPDHGDLAVSIRDEDGSEVTAAELRQIDGETCITDEILLKAPVTVGEHIFHAVLVVHEEDGTSYDASSTEVAFAVKTHAMRLNIWDLSTAIAAGDRFTLKAGIKCSAGCKLTGRELSIFDGEGIEVGCGILSDEVWPGTIALFFAEMEANAPLTVGKHKWEVRISASGSGTPHAAGALAFDVNVVDPPDCEVTVEAFDAGTQTPIERARIVMHPYRAITGEKGVATLKVSKGNYKLLVSGSRYIATARTIEVTDDVTVRAELTLEPIADPASYYTF